MQADADGRSMRNCSVVELNVSYIRGYSVFSFATEFTIRSSNDAVSFQEVKGKVSREKP